MEIYAYVTDWQRLSEEVKRNPAIADSDALFRIMEEAESTWIYRKPSLESNTSVIYNSEIGSLFVELVDDERLSESAARTIGAFLVSFCPQVTELDNYAPPNDVLLPDVFHAALSPDSLKKLLDTFRKINCRQLREAVASYLDEQPSEEISSADEFMGYLQGWRDAMYEAMKQGQGLLVFCG
jgi:hypothetical protein